MEIKTKNRVSNYQLSTQTTINFFMNSRIGKIARLPKQIREQINLRLDNGETAAALVKWLNTLPEVQKLLTEQFAGKPITPQNLSQWRNGGYLEWTRHQQLREQTRWTTEQSDDLHSDLDSNTISLAENVALIMSAELAIHVQSLFAIKKPKERFRQFCILSRELSRIRRDDQRACRTILRREQWNATRPASEPDPAFEELETQNLKIETTDLPETQNSEPETIAQPETEAIEAPAEKAREDVAQTFLSAGSRDFPVPCSVPTENQTEQPPPTLELPKLPTPELYEAESLPQVDFPEPELNAAAPYPNSQTLKLINSQTP
jgi:hypothetical protein